MSQSAVVVDPDTTVSYAMTLMRRRRIHSVIVDASQGNAEYGIVTTTVLEVLSDVDLKVFAMVDGKRSVQDIIEHAFMSDFDVAKILFILNSVNLIRKKK